MVRLGSRRRLVWSEWWIEVGLWEMRELWRVYWVVLWVILRIVVYIVKKVIVIGEF